jgi:hypothetical protein
MLGRKLIKAGTLFKGGHYRLEKGFDRVHYLREDIN